MHKASQLQYNRWIPQVQSSLKEILHFTRGWISVQLCWIVLQFKTLRLFHAKRNGNENSQNTEWKSCLVKQKRKLDQRRKKGKVPKYFYLNEPTGIILTNKNSNMATICFLFSLTHLWLWLQNNNLLYNNTKADGFLYWRPMTQFFKSSHTLTTKNVTVTHPLPIFTTWCLELSLQALCLCQLRCGCALMWIM